MEKFPYDAPAEVFVSRRFAKSTQSQYRRFVTATEALRFLFEVLPPAAAQASMLEVNEGRYDGAAALKLYLSAQYPLVRKLVEPLPARQRPAGSDDAPKRQYGRLFLAKLFGLTPKQASDILDRAGDVRGKGVDLARELRLG